MSKQILYSALDEITVSEIERTGISQIDASSFHSKLQGVLKECGESGSEKIWDAISHNLLHPDHPFGLHQKMYYGVYKGWDTARFGPPPAWIPLLETAKLTNVGRVLQKHGKKILGCAFQDDPIEAFSHFYKLSVQNPEIYWDLVFRELKISFGTPPSGILHVNTPELGKESMVPGGRWLPGAVLNAAENCLIPNEKRKAEDVAIIWQDEGSLDSGLNVVTYEELRAKVCHVANALDTLCLPKGSAIAIDMPMTVDAVVIYLAMILAGYVVVSIADSFAAREISTRIKISNAKAIFTQDIIIRGDKTLPLYSRVIEANAPLAVVVPARNSALSMPLRGGDISWEDFIGRSKSMEYKAVVQPVEAMSNILFSSGTTGEPKAIPWTHATPLKAAADAWAHMDIRPGDVVAWPTNLGWMMGPWLLYASLLNGASMAIYNGSPLGHSFAKFVQDAKVTMLGLVPSLVRAWKRGNSVAGLDWSSIRCYSSSGEASSVDDYLWLMGRAGYKPVIEYCGGTEIGGGFVTGSMLQAQSLAAFSTPAMGCTLFILGQDGNPLPEGQTGIGELALDPAIFGSSTTLLNANHYDVYFKDMPCHKGRILRRHGDEFERCPGGFYRAHGRADDTMNLGGIKVSSVEIERICNGVDGRVLETAAVGIPPLEGGPEGLLIVVVLKDANCSGEVNVEEMKATFNRALKQGLNPLFRVNSIALVSSLPRTASNKVMRRMLRSQFVHLSHPDGKIN